jgi:hypothetical protein
VDNSLSKFLINIIHSTRSQRKQYKRRLCPTLVVHFGARAVDAVLTVSKDLQENMTFLDIVETFQLSSKLLD